MEFLITETQLKTILTEQDKSKMTEDMKTLYSFTENIVNRVKTIYGINLKMLLTWGTSVGGLMVVVAITFFIFQLYFVLGVGNGKLLHT